MKLKRVLAIGLSVVLSASMLWGCGNSKPTDKTTVSETGSMEESTASSGNTTETGTADSGISGSITLWEHANSFEKSLKAIIEGFNKQYPNVEVEYEIKDDTYYSLLTTSIQAGEAPDIFWTNGTSTTNMADLVSNNALLDLTDIVDYSALVKDSLSLGEVDGAMYSVPWMTFDTRACYYNKDIFEENGWAIPATFGDFEKLLKAQKDAGYIPISLCPNDTWSILFFFEPLLSAIDPEYSKGLADYSVKATDQPVADALNKMLEWAKAGYFGDKYLGVTNSDAQSLAFLTGKAAMMVSGSWESSTFEANNPDLNYGAFQIPAEDGTTGMVGSFANGFSIYKDSQNLDAAKAFVQYCASLEAQTTWVQTMGGVSGSPDIMSTNEIANEIADCDNTYKSWQWVLSHYVKEGESATTLWEDVSPKLFSDNISVEELLSEIAKIMQ